MNGMEKDTRMKNLSALVSNGKGFKLGLAVAMPDTLHHIPCHLFPQYTGPPQISTGAYRLRISHSSFFIPATTLYRPSMQALPISCVASCSVPGGPKITTVSWYYLTALMPVATLVPTAAFTTRLLLAIKEILM